MSAELSPGKSIRHYCLWCSGDTSPEVGLCATEGCALWTWRFGQRPETRGLERRADGMTATQAIHNRCRDCYESRGDCGIPDADCALHHVRAKAFGRVSVPSTRRPSRVAASTRVGRPESPQLELDGAGDPSTRADEAQP